MRPLPCKAQAQRRGGAEWVVTPSEVLRIIADKGGVSPRDLVREFAAEPESVARVVEELFECEKIYTDKGGILRIKR